MTYLVPLLDVVGKRPVWSLYTVPVKATVLAYAQWVRTLVSDGREHVVIIGGELTEVTGILVERTFFRSCRKWPFAVARDLSKCLRTRLEVSPGQVVKKPASMAVVQVLMTGLKQAR